MSDGLPLLLPGDPKNLLSVDARKRIHRAIIDADKFVWEAEVAIESRGLDRYSEKAYSLRKDANFKKAKAALAVHHREFSRINIPVKQFRQIMREEIDSASGSLGLSGVQRGLLENQFFFPEETASKIDSGKVGSIEVVRTVSTIRLNPRALRDSYLAHFPDEKIKIRDLCWAAGQHYREWKRWLAGQLKDGSTPDLAFRRILTSGKRPVELNKRPRPKGWE
jgi:hypothetical protein